VGDDYEALVSENHATKAVVDKNTIYAGKTSGGEADGYYYANCLLDINKVATYRDLSLYAAAVWNGNAVASPTRTMEDVASAGALRGGYYDTIKTVYGWLGTEDNPIIAANAADYAALTTVLASDGDLYFYLEDVADTNDLLTTYANGEITQYTITFEMGAGTAISPIDVNYGTPVSALAGISVTPPENYHFVKWQLKTGVDSYVDFVGNEIVTENITVKAIYALNEIAIPQGATLIKDYSTPFTSWVQNWGGCSGNSVQYEEYNGRAGVLGIEHSNTYIACTIVPDEDMSGLSEAVKTMVSANPANYGIVLNCYVTDNVSDIVLAFDGANGTRFGHLGEVAKNEWTTITFPMVAWAPRAIFTILTTSSSDVVIYIDQVYLVELPKYTLTVNGGSADASEYAVNATVTLTVDENAIPEGKEFSYWSVNGVEIQGNTFNMPAENTTVDAVYVTPELAIPEGALMVTDISNWALDGAHPWNNPGYGTGANGVVNKYAEYDGRANVLAYGTNQGSRAYTQWTNSVPSFDGTGYTKLVVRVKIDTTKCVRAVFDDNDGLSLITDATRNQWGEVEFDLGGTYYLTIATDSAGDCVFIDQIYLK